MSEEQESAAELKAQEIEMSVTPNEIRNAEFASAMRGFNREEVDEFMQKAASALEEALAETAELRAQHELLQEKYEKLASMEDALKSTLLEAQKTADTMRASAERDVQLTLERARGKQALVEEQTAERIAQLQEQVRELDRVRLDYQEKIQQTIASHTKILEEMSFSADIPQDIANLEDTDIGHSAIEGSVVEDNIIEGVDQSDSEPAEIEEVTLFESATATVEEVAQPDNSLAFSENKQSDSLHSAMTDLADSAPEQAPPVSATESHSATEAIAQAVENKSATAESKGDTLYKKLASKTDETSQVKKAPTGSGAKEKPADTSKQKARSPLEKGSDGIVVFGRKEDREKAVEENARILSDLDSVVDKFAEDLREVDNK